MALDNYSFCPCGSGKKIKFCCSKDLIHELDKITRAIDGEQRIAALDQINSLLQKKGERASLLALKSLIQFQLDKFDDAAVTVQALLRVAPSNPTSFVRAAMVDLAKEDVDGAVKELQRAMEHLDDRIPADVVATVGMVGRALVSAGNVLGARGHLMFLLLLGANDQESMTALFRINGAAEIPLLMKEDFAFLPCPDDAPWKGEFEAAQKCWSRGCWLLACEQLSSLDEKAPHQLPILRALAILRTWLGDGQRTIAAWRRVAALQGIPLEDAVEAEALAQLIDPDSHAERIDELTLTYAVGDVSALNEILLADRRTSVIPMDPRGFAEADAPPPKSVFWLHF